MATCVDVSISQHLSNLVRILTHPYALPWVFEASNRWLQLEMHSIAIQINPDQSRQRTLPWENLCMFSMFDTVLVSSCVFSEKSSWI